MPGIELPTLVWILLGLPLVTFASLWWNGKEGNKWAGLLAISITSIGFLISIWAVVDLKEETVRYNWIQLEQFTLHLAFRLDSLSALMLPLVHFVALLVQIYSVAYMKGDPAIYRYFAFLQLFVFSMLGIVLAGNLVVMYIFWELVGLSSYLLIGFWYQKPKAVWAAKKAFVLNRIGDAAFLSGILLLMFHWGSADFEHLATLAQPESGGIKTLIGILLFGGAMGKSAQFPLSGWLPDAMEGPTPVSALIHAATMVAAGIFLLGRVAFLLTPTAELFVAVIGLITMLQGSLRALFAWDIKKVLAFSTVSQLGLMVLAVGVGSWQTAIFHLITHAFFKAGLFLSAGSVIHAVTPHGEAAGFDPQDMRNYGGLRTKLPTTFYCYLVCSMALSGLPFFSGFLSKDAVFLQAFQWAKALGGVYYLFPVLALLAGGLTMFYMCRQLWLIFGGTPRYDEKLIHPHESPAVMWVPMALLSGLSIFVWFSWNPFDGSGGWLLGHVLREEVHHSLIIPFLSVAVSALAVFIAYKRMQKDGFLGMSRWSGFFPGIFLYTGSFDQAGRHQNFIISPFQYVAVLMSNMEKLMVDASVNAVARVTVIFAHFVAFVDRHVVDGVVRLLTFLAQLLGSAVRRVQSGRLQSYFMSTVVGILLLLVWILATL